VQVDIVLEGLTAPQQKNVIATMSLAQQKDHPLATAALIKRLHVKAPQEIRNALAPFGHYRVKIEASLTETTQGIEARYRIDPGPALRIDALDVRLTGEGRDEADYRTLLANFPLARGEVLDHTRYEDTKETLQKIAAELGYLDADFTTHEIRIDLDAYRADIVLHFDTGARYSFGAITFEQDILRPSFLQRFSPVREGDPYSVVNLLALQRALADSGYFLRVEVIPLTEQATDLTVPVDVLLTPRPRHRYTAGVGYGTDTGARVSAGWENRRINQFGHRVGVDLLASEINNSQTVRYTIPLRFYTADQVAFTANRYHEWHDDRDELRRSLSVSRSRGREPWRTTVSLTYSDEDFTIGPERNRTRLLMPGINWVRIDADDRIYTTRGSRYILDLHGANSDVVSDISFMQYQMQGKWIRQFGNRTRVLARAHGGYTRVARFDELPSSQRFFAGGDRSVRGYSYESLGPKDAQGTVIGGKSMLVGSLEYEVPIGEKWSAAAFYDAGNAFDEWEPFPELLRGSGLGLRWRTPVGPVRFDLAWALDKPDKPWRFHLTIGPDL
jgi:translocation and assembly module TamA